MSEDTLETKLPVFSRVSGTRPRITSMVNRSLFIDSGLVVAELGNTCVAIWREEPYQFLFDRQASALRQVVEGRDEKTAFLCVVEKSSPPPKEDLRKAAVRMLEEHAKQLACVACVIAGDGFRSAITRSVLSGLSLLYGSREFPTKLTNSVHNAAQWMTTYVHLGVVASYVESVEAYRSLMTECNEVRR